jgi:hypothetical protein
LSAPDWREIRDARARDSEHDRQQNLARQDQLLYEGRLLRAPDLTYERLTDLDFRIAQLTKRHDQAQQALDAPTSRSGDCVETV